MTSGCPPRYYTEPVQTGDLLTSGVPSPLKKLTGVGTVAVSSYNYVILTSEAKKNLGQGVLNLVLVAPAHRPQILPFTQNDTAEPGPVVYSQFQSYLPLSALKEGKLGSCPSAKF